MKHILKYKLLGLPIIIWGFQLLYVAVALVVLVILLATVNKNTSTQTPVKIIAIAYIVVMVIINVIWRLAIKKRLSGWF
jgi:hypothetical protein